MEAIFKCKIVDGKIIPENIHDFKGYLSQLNKKEVIIHLKDYASYEKKERMYAFFHGPLLKCAINAYTEAGYSGIDKEKAKMQLKTMFAKDSFKSEHATPTSLTEFSEERFLKFIYDCIIHLEQDLNTTIPDAITYKKMYVEVVNKKQSTTQ